MWDSNIFQIHNTILKRNNPASRMGAAFPASTWGLAYARRHQGNDLLHSSCGSSRSGHAAQEAAV